MIWRPKPMIFPGLPPLALPIYNRYAPCAGGNCTCDAVQCTILSTDFTGDDSSDITPYGLTESAGDWSIASNKLSIGSANALALGANDAALSDGVSIFAKVVFSNTGNIARLVGGYADANNYHFLEAKAGTGGYLALYRRVGGSNTLITSVGTNDISTGVDIELRLCLGPSGTMSGSYYRASPSESSFSLYGQDLETIAGNGWGLATGGTLTGTVTFDDLNVQEAVDGCSPCTVPCGCVQLIRQRYRLTIDGIVGSSDPGCGTWPDQCCEDCSSLNGEFEIIRSGLCDVEACYGPYGAAGAKFRCTWVQAAEADQCSGETDKGPFSYNLEWFMSRAYTTDPPGTNCFLSGDGVGINLVQDFYGRCTGTMIFRFPDDFDCDDPPGPIELELIDPPPIVFCDFSGATCLAEPM